MATATPEAASTLLKVQRIGKGYLLLRDPDRYVACFKVGGGASPWVETPNTIYSRITMLETAFNQLKPNEQVQIITRRVPADVRSFLEYFKARINPNAPEEFRNEYADYFEKWFTTMAKVEAPGGFESYLFFTILADENVVSNNVFSFLGAKKANREIDPEYVSQRARSWVGNLSAAGLSPEELSGEGLFKLLYEEINLSPAPADSGAFLDAPLNPGGLGSFLSLREKLASTPTSFYSDYALVGRTFVNTFYISDFPDPDGDLADPMFLGNLMNAKIPFKMTLFVRGIEQGEARSKIEAQLRADIGTLQKNRMQLNYESLANKEQREIVLNNIARGSSRLARFSLFITTYAGDPETLAETVDSLKSRFPNVHTLNGKYEQRRLFISALPQGTNQASDREFTMTTRELANLWPFFHDRLTEGAGVPFGISYMGEIVPINPWSEKLKNWNTVVMGMPGGGKSFSILLQLLRHLPFAPYIMVIDKSKSYEFVCKMAGGEYIRVDLSSDQRINIFDVDTGELKAAEGAVSPEKISDLISYLSILLSEQGKDALEPLVNAILIEAIEKTYLKFFLELSKGGTALPRLSNLKETLLEMAEQKGSHDDFRAVCRKYGKILDPFTGKGPYAALTDSRTTINTRSHFVVFDIQGLPNDERFMALGTFIVSQYCLRRAIEIKNQETETTKQKQRQGIAYNPRRSWLFIDEAWILARFSAGINFLKEVAKRSRHMGLASIFATQELKDFLNSPQVEAVLDVANVKVIFQPEGEVEAMAARFRLNDKEKAIVRNLHQARGRYSQCFMMMGENVRGLVSVTPDPVSYWIATTHPDESREREVYLDKYAPSQSLTELWRGIFMLVQAKLRGER
jgi:hypothetical protein